MKIKYFKILVLLLSIITLNSCVFSTLGDSLEAFSRRMNELNESYNMTSEGFIIDTTKSSLTKFFRFSEKEIMLQFKYDKKHRLNEMNLVFDPVILEGNPDSLTFISDCLKSFCQSEEIFKEILNVTDFENTIKTIKKETISAEVNNIKMEIDTTNLGTVITIHKDL